MENMGWLASDFILLLFLFYLAFLGNIGVWFPLFLMMMTTMGGHSERKFFPRIRMSRYTQLVFYTLVQREGRLGWWWWWWGAMGEQTLGKFSREENMK